MGQFRCSACKKYKDPEDFWPDKDITNSRGVRRRCKECDYKISQKYLKNNPGKAQRYRKKFRQSDKWKKSKHYHITQRNQLSDWYVRKCLARYSVHPESWFSDEMVKEKRTQLTLHRAIKEAQKAG